MIDYKFTIVIVIAYFLGNISPSTIQAKREGWISRVREAAMQELLIPSEF